MSQKKLKSKKNQSMQMKSENMKLALKKKLKNISMIDQLILKAIKNIKALKML